MADVTLRGISKRFGQVLAIADIDLDLSQGDRLVLLGRSGAGKTTLLRILCGLTPPDSGTIYLDACDVTRSAPNCRNIALVTQDYALYPQLTVQQNLEAALSNSGLMKIELANRIAEAMEWFQIAPLRTRLPSQLSGGQSQRVALARAIVRRPNLLVLDEPLSQLDTFLRTEVRELLLATAQRFATTLVMVTHDPLDALLIATQIAVVDQGSVIQVGPPQELYDHPNCRLVAELLSPLGINWLNIENFKETPDSHFTGRIPAGKTILGFRPEHAIIAAETHAAEDFISFSAHITQLQSIGFAQLATCTTASQTLKVINHAHALAPGLQRFSVATRDCLWLTGND